MAEREDAALNFMLQVQDLASAEIDKLKTVSEEAEESLEDLGEMAKDAGEEIGDLSESAETLADKLGLADASLGDLTGTLENVKEAMPAPIKGLIGLGAALVGGATLVTKIYGDLHGEIVNISEIQTLNEARWEAWKDAIHATGAELAVSRSEIYDSAKAIARLGYGAYKGEEDLRRLTTTVTKLALGTGQSAEQVSDFVYWLRNIKGVESLETIEGIASAFKHVADTTPATMDELMKTSDSLLMYFAALPQAFQKHAMLAEAALKGTDSQLSLQGSLIELVSKGAGYLGDEAGAAMQFLSGMTQHTKTSLEDVLNFYRTGQLEQVGATILRSFWQMAEGSEENFDQAMIMFNQWAKAMGIGEEHIARVAVAFKQGKSVDEAIGSLLKMEKTMETEVETSESLLLVIEKENEAFDRQLSILTNIARKHDEIAGAMTHKEFTKWVQKATGIASKADKQITNLFERIERREISLLDAARELGNLFQSSAPQEERYAEIIEKAVAKEVQTSRALGRSVDLETALPTWKKSKRFYKAYDAWPHWAPTPEQYEATGYEVPEALREGRRLSKPGTIMKHLFGTDQSWYPEKERKEMLGYIPLGSDPTVKKLTGGLELSDEPFVPSGPMPFMDPFSSIMPVDPETSMKAMVKLTPKMPAFISAALFGTPKDPLKVDILNADSKTITILREIKTELTDIKQQGAVRPKQKMPPAKVGSAVESLANNEI